MRWPGPEAHGQRRSIGPPSSTASSGDTKAAYEKEIKTLKAKRDETAKKLTAMEKSTASSWDSTKQDFTSSYKDLPQSYNKAAMR